MNTSMKDGIKMILAISTLLTIIIIVIIIVVQYQVEGEKNMPYELSKISIISTAECETNVTDENSSKWNFTINQINDVYFSVAKNSAKDDELIDGVTIENISIVKKPSKGEVKVYMPSSVGTGIGLASFSNDETYLVTDKLEYKGGKTSNSKTLEIGNQGGFTSIRFADTNIGKFVSNDEEEVKWDGTLLTKAGALEEDVAFQVNFDFVIQVNQIKYKANISLNLPCENLSVYGKSSREIDGSNFVFKRVK